MSVKTGERTRSDRWELIGALAAACDTPFSASAVRRALDLGPMSGEDHTRVFVLNLPPHASIYLGAEGKLGGEAADRVAGFWRIVGIAPDADPDHLTSLLALYAHLGAAADTFGIQPRTRLAIERMRYALLWEHLWPWVPAYIIAIESLNLDPFTTWARLLRRAMAADVPGAAATVGERAPLALRNAPARLDSTAGPAALLDALVAPVRSGIILTRQRLAAASETIGVGYRLGERRFALKGMLEQNPHATIAWLAAESDRWAMKHADNCSDAAAAWWASRAAATARSLRQLGDLDHNVGPGCGV